MAASLEIQIVNAVNVPNVESVGKSDPYVIAEFQGVQKKTDVKKGDLNPSWNETLMFDLKGQPLQPSDELKVQMLDWELVGRNRLLGTASVPLQNLLRSVPPQPAKLALSMVDANQRPTNCTLNVVVTYKPPPAAKTAAAAVVDDDTDVDQVDGGITEMNEAVTSAQPEDVADGGKRKRSKKKKGGVGTRKPRGPLSTKPADFQIRIKIICARQLSGANISPVVRVTCQNQMKQTHVQKSTNSPFWNEIFFFNFMMSPAELFDEMVTFGVYNSRKLRSDAFIGSFKCDIGLIYDEPQHSLINKWLLLNDPEDNQGGAKGYLKISATVLGAGDEAPSLKSNTEDDEEDIETNLLRPAGITLRPATFKLKVYRAEDLPRMDTDIMQGIMKVLGSEEKKELVDPYFVFSFAGSELKSKILYCTDHPEWNQELLLGMKFPSMCERIKLQIFDWDKLTESDPIASHFLTLGHISRDGSIDNDEEGFLPTFGPCFVNFYGSPREYSDLPDEFEYLNLGKGEGVAYRGRALIELQTILGESPELPINDIHSDDVLRVQKYLRRRKFKLNAAFYNATMISKFDAPVEFEVSIGNYGNKLDESIAPCASTTQPTNAVFDGTHYYFLPWGDTKPCVVIDSHWEDISFRLETLNYFMMIVSRLEEGIEKIKLGLKADLPPEELARLTISALDVLIAGCSKPLPLPVDGYHVPTDLDRLLRGYRESEMLAVTTAASQLRECATDVNEAVNELEGYAARLKNMAIEPQNSMPDVCIWMISGTKRIAYARIPANELLWAAQSEYRGKDCGKLITVSLKYAGHKAEKDGHWEIPALLRLKIWLGLEKDESEWHKMQKDGELAVYAETYENQVNILGKWTNMGPALSRPKWSDSMGKLELMKENFEPPPGWKWDSDWYINPELSLLFDRDAGHTKYTEDVYECQARLPGAQWDTATVPWTDVKGDKAIAREELQVPAGWAWETDWDIDVGRAVDEEGWEYCVEMTMGGWGPVQRTYHMCRRRRWVRTRKMVKDVQAQAQVEKTSKAMAEGWEYAPLFNMPFHLVERTMDLVRRRRWHRKMIATVPGSPCFFQMKSGKSDSKAVVSLTAPRMFLLLKKPPRYQLRAYIYQARDLLAADQTGLSDPFCHVSFLNVSQTTEVLEKTLCPTWDQTLIFDQVQIHGAPADIAKEPPEIVIEFFDQDVFGGPEYLGRTRAVPLVKLDHSEDAHAVLQWYPVTKGSQAGGELLAAFELYLIPGETDEVDGSQDLPFMPPKRGKLYMVPNGIRPVMRRTAVEIMCWGVRNMKRFQLASVTSPSVEFEVGGQVIQSKIISNTNKNPNFFEPLLFLDLMLPEEELYTPPLNVRVRDNRQFGRKPLVGVHTIKTLKPFRCDPVTGDNFVDDLHPSGLENGTRDRQAHVAIEMPAEKGKSKKSFLSKMKSKVHKKKETATEKVEEDIDWWSKYYASLGELDKCKQYLENDYDKLLVYNNSLEKQVIYNNFDDFCVTFLLSRGKSSEEEESNIVGEFKGLFRVYPLPPDPGVPMPLKVFDNLPSSLPQECIIRVYIIKAIDLQPNDSSGLADPYVEIKLGKHTKGSNKEYLPNTLNPVFGKMYEIKATVPLEKDLLISVKDYDVVGADDVIGETVIDLENRLLSKHRATVGLPLTYFTSGPNAWRDSQSPRQLLETFCKSHRLPVPVYASNTVRVGNRVYNLGEYESAKKQANKHLGLPEERLALYVLHSLPPSIGCPLVPEHVETRTLYSPLQPGIEQGKLQMWVDLFPLSAGYPGPPVDIRPRQAKKYELRLVVWNTHDVILEEESVTGEKMSDIYVKCWLQGTENVQETDIHYRSLDGEGNFNWRMVFPFDYLPAEDCIEIKKKEHFWSLDETELRMPAVLVVQIWDNDKFSADDFLGSIELKLNHLPTAAKNASSCSLSQLAVPTADNPKCSNKFVSLFEQKRIKGFWPCFAENEAGEKTLTGKVEMEIELLTGEEAVGKPAGQGRDEPNMNPTLEPPKRPETSFLWFTSPWKTLKHIIWKSFKWYFITGLVIFLLVLILFLFFYSFPSALANRIVGA